MKSMMTAFGLAVLVAGGPVFAQSTTTAPKPPAVASTDGQIDPALARMNADQLKGKNIYGSDGKDIAEIEGVVRKGDRTFAVLDVDGVGGFSGKVVVLPLSQLHMSGDKIAVNMTKNQLQGLEKWQKDQYEDIKGALK
ncbi:PRC-barrel domain protein [Azospirillum baldaniorum]|uniref:PRC-barrel domain-containing protein n=1 Tax=Azospirillum baldaniorum TaxID=1064539 RepID=UPI0011A57FCE|nr:PRC-barrel domain-containing protein [Azospirillum baldaniorum]TWA55981.1 PRC-barrel domain protein [Azospirillum baldaniorum]